MIVLHFLSEVMPSRPGPSGIYPEPWEWRDRASTTSGEASRRQDKPLVRVNCASIPKDLYEGEFFGHTKGVYRSDQGPRRAL